MAEIIFRPIKARPGSYAGIVNGEEIVRSRQPFYDGARALMARGHVACELLEGRHEGSPIVAMRCLLGWAAQCTVEDSDKRGLRLRRWKPYDGPSNVGRGDQEPPKTGFGHSAPLRSAFSALASHRSGEK